MATQLHAAPCVVCSGATEIVETLSVDRLLAINRAAYGLEEPPRSALRAYELLLCRRCSLRFAWPMVPGSVEYYRWVEASRHYYVPARWEWPVIRSHMTRFLPAGEVLDVGCGDGAFASLLERESDRKVVGLDTNPDAIERCRARGLEAHLGLPEDFLGRAPERRFAAIVFSHALEHVGDPAGLIGSALEALGENGRLYASVPYSPQVVEHAAYDPSNLPPHHLTRWNRRSLLALAERFGLALELVPQTPRPLLARVVSEVSFRRFGWRRPTKARRVAAACARPGLLWSALRNQMRRDRLGGACVGDQVLAILGR